MDVLKFFSFLLLCGYCFAEMEVDTNAFKMYRQVQKTTQKNNIKLRFKTIHATGLIMFAQGANKKDFLTLELYRGKVRVAGNYGRGPENKLRPIGGFYDMYLGKDLADNEWHTVEFVRNIRESIIFIDRGTKNEKHNFMKSPPTYNELSVSMVAFGGYYSFDPSEISTDKSLSRKGFKACFTEASFSQVWPEENAMKIDFLKNGAFGNDFVNIGDINQGCSKIQPEYTPMFFPSSAVHLALQQNYTINSLKIGMKFRTVISDQTLANYTTKETGERIQFRIDRKGRIALSIDVNDNTQVVETSKENYHDGEWHDVSFEIDNKLTAENSYIAKFSTDGKTRLSTLSKAFYFDGYVNIAFGFAGCMRDVTVNNDPVYKVKKDLKVENDFFSIYDVGVVHKYCSLKDYCNPNPCYHGGKCNQTEDNIVCDCRDTLYEGSTCHRARFNYTCAGVRKSGERRSDVYFIDFDGMGPMEPVRALCDLGRNVESTTTQVNNTKYIDMDVTTEKATNDVTVNYAANIIQMRELIMNSANCEQYIKFTCKGAPLFRSPEGPPATSWMGGDDILHYYWGGARDHRGYCACGVNQKCRNNKKYCNCDDLEAYRNVWDEGNFTIKQHLPVRQVKFTQVLRARGVQALLRVGHLRCTGFGSRLNAATFRKPWSFLSVDHPDQPFDNIFAGGISFEFKTSFAYKYMVLIHAHGPFSGDYVKIMITSTTMIRVHFNTGFGDLKQDVDISSTGRTLNDNQWHEFDLMFNMKELNVTLDGIQMIQGLPLQDDPFQFNVDDKSVFIGGSYHDKNGFIGCIRSLYVGGRIHDIYGIAQGMEDFGVYPGCGSACVLLNRPCNYGFCIDEYDSFKCNCTVSPNSGKYCGNETYPKKFSAGQFVTYNFEMANKSEPVGEGIFVVGFNTGEENVALAQLMGEDGRHFTLALINGFATLFYSTKYKVKVAQGLIQDTDTEVLVIRQRKLNNKKHNIVRVRFSTEEMFLTVTNYELEVGSNFTERFIDPNNLNRGMVMDVFGKPVTFTVGAIQNPDNLIDSKGAQLPTSYSGCMSGAKFIYNPRATPGHRFRSSFEFDMFRLIEGGAKPDPNANPSGTFPSPSTERCGPTYPLPGTLPSVGPPTQFFTKSPGLDSSVLVTAIDAVNQAILMIVILVVAVVLLGFLYLIYRYVNANNKKYNEERRKKIQDDANRAIDNLQQLRVEQAPYKPFARDDKWEGGAGTSYDEFL